ncbi:putative Rho GTPase activation protein [Helianthus anomalus]
MLTLLIIARIRATLLNTISVLLLYHFAFVVFMLHFNFTQQSCSKNTKVYHVFIPGKTEFGSDEDAHVVSDCVKHVLRELPSSPVPASCCTALLEAHSEFISLLILVVTFGIRILILLVKQGIDRKEARVNAMCCNLGNISWNQIGVCYREFSR